LKNIIVKSETQSQGGLGLREDKIISALIGPAGLDEMKKIEYDIKLGGMQNDQENNKN